jgi:hypothetical protein
MKKTTLVLILLLTYFSSNAQISVSSSSEGSLDKFKPEVFKNFKKTTTIFILSNVYDKSEYEKLLKETWTVTPYKLVSPDEFNYKDYLSDKYSFAHLVANVNSGSTFYLHSLIDFYMLDMTKISPKLEKAKEKPEKFIDLILENKIKIACIELFADTEMLAKINKNFGAGGGFALVSKVPDFNIFSKQTDLYSKKMSDYKLDMIPVIYDKKTYKNYSIGMLKNYFQKLNDLLTKEEFYWMYEIDNTNEVKNLKSTTLFIPDYNKITYNPRKLTDENKSDKELKELFKDYKYKYEFISENDLDSRIKNNEDIYYLRYVRVNNQKFFHIVNGKTGEVIYRFYEAGMGTYNIDDKDFKDLSKVISN